MKLAMKTRMAVKWRARCIEHIRGMAASGIGVCIGDAAGGHFAEILYVADMGVCEDEGVVQRAAGAPGMQMLMHMTTRGLLKR